MTASMQRLGVAPSIGTPKDFADFIADEAPKWAGSSRRAACRSTDAVCAETVNERHCTRFAG